MSQSNCPSLYQIDTRQWTSKLSERVGGLVTLDNIPNSEIDRFSRSGFSMDMADKCLPDDICREISYCTGTEFQGLKIIQINYLIPRANAY
jgi:hypothetical protein